jgi:KUP system potassium uptake protein
VIYALHPKYAIHLITMGNGQGFWLLGAVFLCTTGAEALYSDLGHCGKGNIRVSWGFVKVCLILNYMGQAAWLMGHKGELLHEPPFYGMMPDSFRPIGVGIATMATIIASQALITGTFTLANEAMKLKLWPHMKVSYPTQLRGQIYISRMNWLLMFGCMLVVLIFQESGKMEAAYGLAITINLLMTTALLILHLYFKHKDDRSILKNKFTVFGLLLLFLVIETAFFVANIVKFWHGGWFTIIIAVGFIFVMFVLHQARKLRSKYYDFEPLEDRVDLIREVSSDQSIPKEASNLVYLSLSNNPKLIDKNIIYSITRKRPKRADVYWFLHVEIDDDPSTKEYKVDEIVAGKIYFVRLKFGFKIEHRVNLMFRYVVDELIKEEKIEKFSNYPSLSQHGIRSDFKFMLLNSRVSVDDDISPFDQFIIRAYRVIKKYSLATQELFGLDTTNFEEETVPIDVGPIKPIKLERKEEVVRHETGADGHDIIIGSIRKEINEDSQDAIDQ